MERILRMHNRLVSGPGLAMVAAMLLASRGAWCDGPLRELFRAELSVHTPVNFVAGQIDGRTVFCVQGDALRDGKRVAAVDVLGATGNRVRTFTEPGPSGSSQSGAYLQWIEDKDGPLLLFSWVPGKDGVPGGANLVRIASGEVVARIDNKTRFGNNNSIVADIDRDGNQDLLYADQQSLAFCALPSLEQRWRADTGVNFCWSLPAFVDVTGDDRAEIVYGSEYNNPDGSSSFIALDAQGNSVWRSDGYAEDLGSTPVFVADVDGDNVEELIKVGLDLEHRSKQEWNHVHVFDARGQLKSRVAFGCTGIAIANLDSDAALEGVGITNTRDGGNNGQRAIRCIDLASGKVAWETRIERSYLDDNSPVAADLNGDGAIEIVVGTGNPWGYARLKDSEPWGDQYVVSARGEIVQRVTLPGRPTNSALVDIDGDGMGELVTVLDGQPGWLAVYKTSARVARREWHAPFGSAQRDGTMAKLGLHYMRFTVTSIATVHNERRAIEDDDWLRYPSEIRLNDDIPIECLEGIEAYSHIEIVYIFHKTLGSAPVIGAEHPRENPAWPKVGIYAQRKKARPNFIGCTIATLLRRNGRSLFVERLDAIDGTPVLDIKPVLREFLPVGEVRQPAWVDELMRNYW